MDGQPLDVLKDFENPESLVQWEISKIRFNAMVALKEWIGRVSV